MIGESLHIDIQQFGKGLQTAIKGTEKAAKAMQSHFENVKPIHPKAWNKIEKEAEKTAKEIQKDFEKISYVDDAKAKKDFDGLGKKAKFTAGGFGDLAGAMSAVPYVAAVTGAAAVGKELFDLTKKVQAQQNQVQRLTGLGKEQTTKITAGIKAVAATFDSDFNDTLRATNALSKQFGIDQSEALSLVEKGFLAGGDVAGDLLSTMEEYSSQITQTGLAADEMLAIMIQAQQQGTFSDKGIDAIKEAGIRLTELTPAAEDALNAIGLPAKEMETQLRSGTLSLFEGVQKISEKMKEIPETSKEMGMILADVFGGAGEDAAKKFLKSLGDMELSLDDILLKNADFNEQQVRQLELNRRIAETQVKLANALQPIIAAVYDIAIGLYDFLKETLEPVFDTVVEVAGELWEEIKAVGEIFGVAEGEGISFKEILSGIAKVLSTVLSVAIKSTGVILQGYIFIVKSLIKVAKKVVTGIYDWAASIPFIKSAIEGLIGVVKEIAGFISDLASGIGDLLGLTNDDTKATEKNTKAKDLNAGATQKQTEALTKHQQKLLDRLTTKQQVIDALEKMQSKGVEGGAMWDALQAKLKSFTKSGAKPAKKSLSDLTKELAKMITLNQQGLPSFDKLADKIVEQKIKIDKENEALKTANELLDQRKRIAGGIPKIELSNTKVGPEGIIPKAQAIPMNPEIEIGDFTDTRSEFIQNIEDMATAGESFFGVMSEHSKQMENDVLNASMSMAQGMGQTLGAMLAEGETSFTDFGKVIIAGVLDTVSDMILSYSPAILAAFVSSLGPWGIPAGLAAIAVVQGMLAFAKSSVGAQEGYMEGVQPFGTPGPRDTVHALIDPEEIIIPRDIAKSYRPLFEHIMTKGDPIDYFIGQYPNMGGQELPKNRNANKPQRVDVQTAFEHSFSPLKMKSGLIYADYRKSRKVALRKS